MYISRFGRGSDEYLLGFNADRLAWLKFDEIAPPLFLKMVTVFVMRIYEGTESIARNTRRIEKATETLHLEIGSRRVNRPC